MKLTYPSVRTPDEAFNQATLALASAQVLAWRQGAGIIGGLHLHDCWNDESVLSRGYHGPTTYTTGSCLQTAAKLAQATGDPAWWALAASLATQLLWQQAPGGGFFHASAEYEPTYLPTESCPIHQMRPLTCLLHYYELLPEGAPLRALIAETAARHVQWFAGYWWRRGNGWVAPLDFPGWCGVTNQDLVAISALADYGRVLGDWGPFEQHGLPALETYLGPRYFKSHTGLFLRGDRPQFTERCNYMDIIITELRAIESVHPDARLRAAIERATATLRDAVFQNECGEAFLYWGANDEATSRSGEVVWDKSRAQLSFNAIGLLQDYPEQAAALERTVAHYVFVDGSYAGAPRADNPLFSVAPSASNLSGFWKFLAQRHPQGVAVRDLPPVPCVERRCGDITFTNFAEGWVIRSGEAVRFRGIKRVSHGVVPGESSLPNYKFIEPAADIVEEVAL